jgi:hypothetical protein
LLIGRSVYLHETPTHFMTPLPLLPSASALPAIPGAAPAAAVASVDFAALLPAVIVPGLPRQAVAETGKDLPAAAADEEELAGDTAVAWTIPPLWDGVRAPVVAGEAVTPADVPAVAAPALPPSAAFPLFDTAPAGRFPGEGRGPVATGPLLNHKLRPTEMLSAARDLVVDPAGPAPAPSTEQQAPSTIVPQLGPGLRRGAGASEAMASTSHPALQAEATPPTGSSKDQPTNPAAPQQPGTRLPADPIQPLRVAPAAQVFAAALHQAARDERRSDAPEPTITGIPLTTDLTPHAVTAAENTRHAALDMARDTWPGKMIERIDMMRDALDAADTSIRLVPDKLGAIDVSLRKDGDTVQVQFTAHQAETRQLLADAQPKLAELAEAKGLRLSAQLGDRSGQHQQQRAPTTAPQHATNNRPSRAASNDDAAVADERIA